MADPELTHERDEWVAHDPPALRSLRQFLIRYWFGISNDRIYVDTFLWLSRRPTRREADEIVTRALRKIGYWTLASDSTHPAQKSPLFRDDRGLMWDYLVDVQVPSKTFKPDEFLITKFKIQNYAEGAEPTSPKEIRGNRRELL